MGRKPDCKQKLIINVSFKPQIQNTQLFRDDEPLHWNLCTAPFHQSLCCFNIQSRNLSVFSFCLFFSAASMEYVMWKLLACCTMLVFFSCWQLLKHLLSCFIIYSSQLVLVSRSFKLPFLSNLRLIAIQLLGGCFFVSTQTEEISCLITRNFQRYLILNLSLW